MNKKKIPAACIVLVIALIACAIGVYHDALFQEGNPLPVLAAIVRLEIGGEEYMQFAPGRYLSKPFPDGDRYRAVTSFMERDGWAFSEQMGAALIFKKDGMSKAVTTRQYSRFYYVWEAEG